MIPEELYFSAIRERDEAVKETQDLVDALTSALLRWHLQKAIDRVNKA